MKTKIAMILLICIIGCNKKQIPVCYERECTPIEKTLMAYEVIVSYMMTNYSKYPHYMEIDKSRINDTNYVFRFYDMFEKHISNVYGKRVDYMPSGTTIYIYLTPTNEPHPYDKYYKRDDNSDISMSLSNVLESYDISIGNIWMYTNK